jgi:hypothetical protein
MNMFIILATFRKMSERNRNKSFENTNGLVINNAAVKRHRFNKKKFWFLSSRLLRYARVWQGPKVFEDAGEGLSKPRSNLQNCTRYIWGHRNFYTTIVTTWNLRNTMRSETKNISIQLHKFRLQYEISSGGTKFIHMDDLYSGTVVYYVIQRSDGYFTPPPPPLVPMTLLADT